MTKPIEIGLRIKTLRGETSMRDFAAKLQVSFAAYQNYEYGKRIPPGPVLSRIAEIGGVTVDWILTGEERQPAADRVAEPAAPYGLDDTTSKILQMLKDMDPDARCDVLKYAEKEKLLAELKRERKKEAG